MSGADAALAALAAIAPVAARFRIAGEVVAVAPVAGGHIHRSWRVETKSGNEGTGDGGRAYLLQRLNRRVFPRPELVMDNVARVTAHLAGPLRLVPTVEGAAAHVDAAGEWWRVYGFLEHTVARDTVTSAEEAHAAARAYGEFQRRLGDYRGPRLHETIPGFHDTPRRLAAFERAVAEDRAGRAAGCRAEIESLLARRALAPVLLAAHARGDAPERIVHNDAKLANVLFDAASGAPVCVVDLDTVMPGLALYDFGDMVRSMASDAAEDAAPECVRVLPERLEALASGYLAGAGDLLTRAERALLLDAARVITYEQALRFLADHLAGDVYYPVARAEHNLARARAQIALLEGLET